MHDKIIYSPAEFAKIFSREKTWTYRQLYNLKIDAITDFGRTMIPASQIARIESHAAAYRSKGKKGGKSKMDVDTREAPKLPDGNLGQAATINAGDNVSRVIRQKGMGSRAIRI